MTKKDARENLKDILAEATMSENSVCYVTGDDAETLETAIKALEQQSSDDDCVSRQAIDHLCFEYLRPNTDNNIAFYEHFCDLPPVTPTQSWIPVSERLPEDRNPVLVTTYWHETYQVMMASYFGDGLWWCVPFNNCGDHMQKLNPKAWQPLPKPYEVKRGSENG